MRISEGILYLQCQLYEYGDIDMICVTPGCGSDFESAPPVSQVSRVFDTKEHDRKFEGITTDKYLYIGIDG